MVVDGPSLYCANGRGGYLMKSCATSGEFGECLFGSELERHGLVVVWGVSFLEKNFLFLFDYTLWFLHLFWAID